MNSIFILEYVCPQHLPRGAERGFKSGGLSGFATLAAACQGQVLPRSRRDQSLEDAGVKEREGHRLHNAGRSLEAARLLGEAAVLYERVGDTQSQLRALHFEAEFYVKADRPKLAVPAARKAGALIWENSMEDER